MGAPKCNIEAIIIPTTKASRKAIVVSFFQHLILFLPI
jgi:hypothetical protein